MNPIVLLVIGIMPLLASALICGIHLMLRKPGETPQDRVEKQTLGLMLLPVLIGLGFLLLARLAPSIMTSSLPVAPSDGDTGKWITARSVIFISQVKIDWLKMALWGVTLAYAAVTVFAGLRLLSAQWKLLRVARQAVPSSPEPDVRITGVTVPAFAWRRAIILPENLIPHLSESQLAMVIAHERAHLMRGDVGYYMLLSWINVIFWFNPFVRHQTTRCRLAAELACDALVTQAHPEMRQDYAASLLLALKHSAGNALSISTQTCVPAVISPSNSGEFKMRLTEIMRASVAGRKRGRWIAPVAAAALMVPLVGGQFILSQHPAQASMVAQLAGASLFSTLPVNGEVTSGYGQRVNPLDGKPQFHQGIDFRASAGTPVLAPAAGRVVTVRTDTWNGLYMEIDHGGGYVTRYTHLKRLTIKDNATVSAGQQIAEVGESGKATGPHLHFAVYKDGQPVDPATVLPQLHADASVALYANNMNKDQDGVTVAWGSVEVHVGDRIVHAKRATYDPTRKTLVADGKTVDITGQVSAQEF